MDHGLGRGNVHPVGDAKDEKDAKVAPLGVGRNAERLEVLGPVDVGAVSAVIRVVRVQKVAATSLAYELASKIEAGLTGRRVEVRSLVRGTMNRASGQGGREHTRDPVRGGIEIIELER